MFYKIGIVGSGAMGRGIAQLLAQSGSNVVIHDVQSEALRAAFEQLKKTFATLESKGKITHEQATSAMARIQIANELSGLSPCDLVIEAIVEKLEVKQALFKRLEDILSPDSVLASNTSSLSITAIAAVCKRPENVVGLHFFNPVPLMRVVEVIRGIRTNRSLVARLMALIQSTGHAAVVCSDFPGFIVNHAGRAYNTESLRLVGEGVTASADRQNEGFSIVDSTLKEQVQIAGRGGFRLGPFELMDLTALDVSHPVMESIYRQFYDEPRFRPSVITAQRLAGGQIGKKVGRGFYAYDGEGKVITSSVESADIKIDQPGPSESIAIPEVWVGPGLERARVLELIQSLGGILDEGARPLGSSLCILLPEGKDCTAEALENQVPAERSIALDTLFPFQSGACKRRVMMCNPATLPQYRTAAKALLGADRCAVTVLNDSPGFIAGRVVAMIVSIGTEIAQQGIASPEDIDTAVSLGLGYPVGPLSMGDALGPRRILGILEDMFQMTGDPRYRPGLWLRRRAMLGLSLLQPDRAML